MRDFRTIDIQFCLSLQTDKHVTHEDFGMYK